MITERHIDLFDSCADVIAHQVNCQGVMGSGVAKQVREKFPDVYNAYRIFCETAKKMPRTRSGRAYLLGQTQAIETRFPDGRSVVIANMFAQEHYGYSKKLYTDYDALAFCLNDLRRFVTLRNTYKTIAIPYRLGCCRGGGDWDGVVLPMIKDELFNCDVTICRLDD